MNFAQRMRLCGIGRWSCWLRRSLLLLACCASSLPAQPLVHYRYRSDLPPGEVGAQRLRQGLPLHGYVQPVQLKVPEGAAVSIASDGSFSWSSTSLRVGLLVGQVYRLQVTEIPRHEGLAVYPSLELIDRLYPPAGQKLRFPIPVHITQEDLELALAGKLVVRVIYLENPQQAEPRAADPNEQQFLDVLPGEDPLQVADEWGRPMAILRMGSRLPAANGPDAGFLFGSPPVMPLQEADGLPIDSPGSDRLPRITPAVPNEPPPGMEPLTPAPAAIEGKVDTGVTPVPGPELNDPFVNDAP